MSATTNVLSCVARRTGGFKAQTLYNATRRQYSTLIPPVLHTNVKQPLPSKFVYTQAHTSRNFSNLTGSGSSWNWNNILQQAILFAKRPLGWEHFPPSKKNAEAEKDNSKTTEDKDKDKKTEAKGTGGGGGGFNFDPNDFWKRMMDPRSSLLLLLGLALVFFTSGSGNVGNEMTWNDFLNNYLAKGLVEKLVVENRDIVKIYGKNMHGYPQQVGWFRIGNLEVFEERMEEAQRILGKDSKEYVPIVYQSANSLLAEVLRFVPTLALIGISIAFTRGMAGGPGGSKGIFSVGKSNAKKFKKEASSVTFNDVAGLPEAKQEVEEFVMFLKNPKKYQDLGAKIPKGAMLVGPPGTGKTLLAKAVAGEASVPFYSTSGSDFIEMFVGVGPARVRDLFANARDNAPCIVFIDEIDAIGRARGKGGFSGGNDERENTLNQLLVEMDGFTPTTGVVVLAGTNRPDVLDQALLRPGRFDRQINVDNPDLKSREEIFLVHLKPLKLAKPAAEYVNNLATLTPGFSGADISNVCNEAALIAARKGDEAVDTTHFEQAIERVIGGLEKKNLVMSPAEKKRVAFHEAGHAVVSWFLEHASPLLKVSIIPRGSAALGYAQYVPKDQYLHTREQMEDSMCMAMGGRAAEVLMLGTISTGAQDDLERVTNMAYSQVKIYGMNNKIGPLSFPRREEESHVARAYSEETAQVMDEEVRTIVSRAYTRTRDILSAHLEGLRSVATLLLEKEVIRKDDIESILGPRPFPIPAGPIDPPVAGEHPTAPPPPTNLP